MRYCNPVTGRPMTSSIGMRLVCDSRYSNVFIGGSFVTSSIIMRYCNPVTGIVLTCIVLPEFKLWQAGIVWYWYNPLTINIDYLHEIILWQVVLMILTCDSKYWCEIRCNNCFKSTGTKVFSNDSVKIQIIQLKNKWKIKLCFTFLNYFFKSVKNIYNACCVCYEQWSNLLENNYNITKITSAESEVNIIVIVWFQIIVIISHYQILSQYHNCLFFCDWVVRILTATNNIHSLTIY